MRHERQPDETLSQFNENQLWHVRGTPIHLPTLKGPYGTSSARGTAANRSTTVIAAMWSWQVQPKPAWRPNKQSLTYCEPETDTAPVWLSTPNSTFYPFTSERFHVLWTLSSKFFSTVPHGTCSLSDSRSYLALGGAYHLLRAAIPNNPTLRTTITASLQVEATTNRPFTCFGQTTIKRSRVARLIGYNRQFQTPQLPVAVEDNGIRLWAFPISLAVTLGIIVIFFFSA
jgi:hypothetical protein